MKKVSLLIKQAIKSNSISRLSFTVNICYCKSPQQFKILLVWNDFHPQNAVTSCPQVDKLEFQNSLDCIIRHLQFNFYSDLTYLYIQERTAV